ncbi:MAG: aminoglycoside phosphotransferase family protein [Patescibacteria group bacterium]
MKTIRGKFNTVQFIDAQSVQKVAIDQKVALPSRLKIEAWALSFAKKNRINVPRVLKYYLNSLGQEVLVTERINGETLSPKECQKHPQYLEDIGNQMALLGQVSSGYGWIDPVTGFGCHKTWPSFLECLVWEYGSELVHLHLIEDKLLVRIQDAIKKTNLFCQPPFLLHRDLRPANFLRDREGKIWIIDWERAILGDPLYDIAMVGVRHGHGIFWEGLRKGYNLSISPWVYTLYEVIVLLGTADFYRQVSPKYQNELKITLKELHQLVQNI